MQEIIDGIPNIVVDKNEMSKLTNTQETSSFMPSNIDFNQVNSSFGIALHMHQPTIPAGGGDLSTALPISNLQHMMENQHIGDNHNAPVFMHCYERMSDLIKNFVDAGKYPRVMLDYSGNLLWGLRQIEEGRVLENLKTITTDDKYYPYVEWLGTMWSHAVVTSTPIPDIKYHILAWRKHFAAIFGAEALARVKGFSPPEMHLPIHPDVCFEYIKTLKDCGYEWMLVQEHTIENVDGTQLERPHYPHKLIAKNSKGQTQEITVLIKTQGSDTKLVAQMQPYYEAKSISRADYANKNIPPFVCQIADGENGGVMMNEFTPVFEQVFNEVSTQGVVGLNGSEYLDHCQQAGVEVDDFIAVQPITQHRIWDKCSELNVSVEDAIKKLHEEDSNFNLDQGSWTSDRNWVKGYEDVLTPMNQLSVDFHKKFDRNKVDTKSVEYRNALLYLLLSQTSCFRYWGEGLWTEYAKELCRRGNKSL